jgi:hypothetical protein
VTNGVVTGVAAGTAGITASSGGITSNSVTVTITTAPPQASAVVINKPWVFFTAPGQSAQLTAWAVDAQGTAVPGAVAWTSSAPDKISVDASGRLVANAIGSAQIFAQTTSPASKTHPLADIKSPPTLVMVAEPKAGTLLVTDAQVVSVGPPLGLAAGEAPGVGTQYEVTLRGVAAPSSGTLVLAAETAPVAGKVVSTRQNSGNLVVTLAISPLYELFTSYNINYDIDLSAFPVEDVPDQSASQSLGSRWNRERYKSLVDRAAGHPLGFADPFEAVKCKAEFQTLPLETYLSLKPNNKLHLVNEYDPSRDYSKQAVEGSWTLVGSAGVKLKAGLRWKGGCVVQKLVVLPIFGAVSWIISPAVRLGLFFQHNIEILITEGKAGVDGELGFSGVIGFECGDPKGTPIGGTPSPCRSLNDTTPIKDVKTVAEAPSAPAMKYIVTGQIGGLVGLDIAGGGGVVSAGILEVRTGPKQTFDLSWEPQQASQDNYASFYDLKWETVVQPGPGLKSVIEQVSPTGKSTDVKFAALSTKLSESPKGNLSVSKSRVAVGTPVDFTVGLDPSTVNYLLLGYNVSSVELYRKREDEPGFTQWKSITPSASNQTTYQYHWVPVGADVGKYEFAAFVNTKLPTPWLEVNPNSIQKVEVSCFGPSPLMRKFSSKASLFAMGSWIVPKALTCADTWVGTASNSGFTLTDSNSVEAQLTLKVDPGLTGDPAVVYYYAEGTVKVKEEFFPAANGDGGCTYKAAQATFGLDQIARNGGVGTNQFQVDYSTNPATFGGQGIVLVTQTIECTKQAPTTERIGYYFLVDDRLYQATPLSEDGLSIQATGVSGSPPLLWSFKLTRP